MNKNQQLKLLSAEIIYLVKEINFLQSEVIFKTARINELEEEIMALKNVGVEKSEIKMG